jgi:hypothetical protein
VHLLAEFKKIADSGKAVVATKAVMAVLRRDPLSRWMDFNRGKPITEIQVARLLEPYGPRPRVIHPTKRSTSSPRGYVLADFADAFVAGTISGVIRLLIKEAYEKHLIVSKQDDSRS